VVAVLVDLFFNVFVPKVVVPLRSSSCTLYDSDLGDICECLLQCRCLYDADVFMAVADVGLALSGVVLFILLVGSFDPHFGSTIVTWVASHFASILLCLVTSVLIYLLLTVYARANPAWEVVVCSVSLLFLAWLVMSLEVTWFTRSPAIGKSSLLIWLEVSNLISDSDSDLRSRGIGSHPFSLLSPPNPSSSSP
jgi:RsiW-degrading membrane proteinase PrsW (M82 family)